MCEQGGSFEKAPMVDLYSSSNEEGTIPDTSCDAEFARKVFANLNRDVLGLPSDGNIIILSDSDEEEKVHDAEVAPSSAVRSPAPTASVDNANDADKGDSLEQAIGGSNNGGDEDGLTKAKAAVPRWCLQGDMLQGEIQGLSVATLQIPL
jgi:hypothetical protein